MRLLVAGAMYLASGALFSTIETVAGENPLCVATSRIVTAWFFSLGRFKGNSSLAQIILDNLLRRHLKRQRLPEPPRLPNPERNPRDHPDAAHHFRRAAQAPPQPQANEKSEHRRNKIPHLLLFRVQKIANESGRVHSHKRNQRAKVQKLDASPEGQKKRPYHCQRAHKNNVVSRHLVLRINESEKGAWQRIASPHPVKQASRPDMCTHAGPKISYYQREPHNGKQW